MGKHVWTRASPCLISFNLCKYGDGSLRTTDSRTVPHSAISACPCLMDDSEGKITNSTVDLHCSGWRAAQLAQGPGVRTGTRGKVGKSPAPCTYTSHSRRRPAVRLRADVYFLRMHHLITNELRREVKMMDFKITYRRLVGCFEALSRMQKIQTGNLRGAEPWQANSNHCG